jgi:ethanolamine utilization protein EutN
VKLGRVVGTVVSTINHPSFDERTLLLCDLLDPSGRPSGGYLIAVDSVGAGAGETVLLLDEGTSARQVLRAPGAPIRTVVVGIVDAVVERPAAFVERPAAAVGPAVVDGPAAAAPATVRPTPLAAGRPVRPGRRG